MIQAEHLQKIFRVRKRNAGFKNAAKAFFTASTKKFTP